MDLERGLFICRVCGAGGGVKRFRELVGDLDNIPATARPRLGRSPMTEAHEAALREARGQRWTEPGVRELYGASDWFRARCCLVASSRRAATIVGPTARAWKVLAAAAELERSVVAVEGLLDELAALVHRGGR